MLLEVTELSEALLAEGAGVGFHPRVDADVLGQVAGVGKGLGAVRALVRFGLCVVPVDRGMSDGRGTIQGGGGQRKTREGRHISQTVNHNDFQ